MTEPGDELGDTLLIDEDYSCSYLDENGNGEQDYDRQTFEYVEPYTKCEPPKLIHRGAAVAIMLVVSMALSAFAGTYIRLGRGGNPWAGFVLGGLLGLIGPLAAAVVPVPEDKYQ